MKLTRRNVDAVSCDLVYAKPPSGVGKVSVKRTYIHSTQWINGQLFHAGRQSFR